MVLLLEPLPFHFLSFSFILIPREACYTSPALGAWGVGGGGGGGGGGTVLTRICF